MDKCFFVFVEVKHTTGQSRVVRLVQSILNEEFDKLVVQKFAPGFSFLNVLKAMVYISAILISPNNKVVYLTCSRSKLGFLRDLPFLLLAKINIPVYVHVHGADFIDLLHGSLRHVVRFAYKNVHVIYPNSFDKNKFIEYCHNVFTLPAPSFSWVTEKKDIPRFKIVWSSNLLESKGIFLVVEALTKLSRRRSDFCFVCFGEALSDEFCSGVDVLRRIKQTEEAHDWFHFVGSMPDWLVQSEVRNSCLVCLPSVYRSESQGLAAIDAACSGVGVIISSMPCLVAGLDGYPSNVVDFCVDDLLVAIESHINEFNSSPDLYFQRRSRPAKTLQERYSFKMFRRNLLLILET